MRIKSKNRGFTLVELLVVITLISIIAVVSFIGLSGFNKNGKDAVRLTDMENLKTSFKSYKLQNQTYPLPSDPFNITNSGVSQVMQGKITNDISLDSTNIPKDPNNIPYTLSVTNNKQFYQIGMTLENNGSPTVFTDGNYKSISPDLFPSLILADNSTGSIEIHTGVENGSTNRNKFVIDKSVLNLAYDLTTANPVSKATDYNSLIGGSDNNIGSEYESCQAIFDADKYLGVGNYVAFNFDLETLYCDCSSGICTQTVVSQDGSCNNTEALGCNVGSATNDNGVTTLGALRTWTCTGITGGKDKLCSIVNSENNGIHFCRLDDFSSPMNCMLQ